MLSFGFLCHFEVLQHKTPLPISSISISFLQDLSTNVSVYAHSSRILRIDTDRTVQNSLTLISILWLADALAMSVFMVTLSQ